MTNIFHFIYKTFLDTKIQKIQKNKTLADDAVDIFLDFFSDFPDQHFLLSFQEINPDRVDHSVCKRTL